MENTIYMYMCIIELLCYVAEMNTKLQIKYLDKINFLEKESEDDRQKREKLQIQHTSLLLPLCWPVRETFPPRVTRMPEQRHLTDSS